MADNEESEDARDPEGDQDAQEAKADKRSTLPHTYPLTKQPMSVTSTPTPRDDISIKPKRGSPSRKAIQRKSLMSWVCKNKEEPQGTQMC